MNILKKIVLLLLGFLGSCGKTYQSNSGNFGKRVKLNISAGLTESSRNEIILRFEKAHSLSDSIVKLVIRDSREYRRLMTSYGFDYPSLETSIEDTVNSPAEQYKFYYSLLFNDDTVKAANISICSDMRINSCEIFELIAYKQFLDGKIKVGPKEAINLAIPCGVKKDNVSVTFHATEYSLDTLRNMQEVKALYESALVKSAGFFWQVSNDCDGCVWLRVDAESGKVFHRGNVEYLY